MNILHGTWIPSNNDAFINSGAFYLWVETSIINKKKGKSAYHSMHLRQAELIEFVGQSLGIKAGNGETVAGDIIEDKQFTLPSADGTPLPSYDMMRYEGQEPPQTFEFSQCQFSQWPICCYKLSNAVRALNDIHFASLYQSDFKIGADLLFWYHFSRVWKAIVIKDQYIPALRLRKLPAEGKRKPERFELYTGWQIISEQYESAIRAYLPHMPCACLAGAASKTEVYSKESLLRHFSEYMLDELISRTHFTAAVENNTAGTFVINCINGAEAAEPLYATLSASVELEDYRRWARWRDNLALGASAAAFKLCFKLTELESEQEAWFISFVISPARDLSLQMPLSEYWALPDKDKTGQFGADIEKTLLLNMGYAARMYPKIWDGLETDRPAGVYLNTAEVYEFLSDSAWVLEDSGYRVIVPAWWTPQGRKRPKIRLKTSQSSSALTTGHFSLDSIVSYRYELSIADQTVTEKQWRQLINAKSPLVKFRGQWIELDRDKMSEMLEFWQSHSKENPEIHLKDMIKMASDKEDEIEFDHDEAIAGMLSRLYEKNSLELVQPPSDFNGMLRQYQIRGLSWLMYLEGLGLNPCLADDMGLGKTVQIIALMLRQRQSTQTPAPTLLIAPTSVLGNWGKEVQRFAPRLRVLIHYGGDRIKQPEAFRAECEKLDMVITSYSLLRRDEKLLRQVSWKRVVVDEAQNIKNPKSAQTKAVLKLEAHHRVALTGTPIENRLLDLWSIFNYLNPGYLGTMSQFNKQFELPIQKDNDIAKSNVLRKLVEPFILRRLKTDKEIIKDLPDKVEQKVYCNLTKEQASLYGAVVKDVETQIEDTEGIKRKGLILSTLMKLKQICNHPRQFLKDDSEFTKERSHKLSRLCEMIQEVIESGQSLLIFSQFREICGSLVSYIRKTYHYNTYYIAGDTNMAKRQQQIEEFQREETPPSVFVLSLKAGGVGITLTRASHVFHFDRWYNPSVEDQATDRAFRIGQTKNVFAHKFVTIGTLEERIDAMIEDKKKIASSIIGADESWLTELDNEAFKKLIAISGSAMMEEA